MRKPEIKKIVEEFAGDLPVVMATKFGSHLYGTDTANSDTDIKGIFMPTRSMVCLGNIPKSLTNSKAKAEGQKNTKDDIDLELYSFHYFMHLAMQGETVAIDMIHANDASIVMSSDLWENLYSKREKLYTKNLRSFVGYARKQAAKYGIKGSRLSVAKSFIDVCTKNATGSARMSDVWGFLPVNEHANFIEDNQQGVKQYQICGKIIQDTVTIDYACGIVARFVKQYGARAKQAEENKGVDFKAISHALRAAYQMREILMTGDLAYPLKQAEYLRDVKEGKYHYAREVAPVLESLMDNLDYLVDSSHYPEKVDRAFWNGLIVSVTADFISDGC